jgi:1-acyl-sn-glycerol-3-phosphate acyltransferase
MPERMDPIARALRRGFAGMVRRGLRGVWVRGQPPPGPFVWAANHHSWWDPFLASVLLDRWGRAPCLIMEQENLQRYAFTRRLGVFGTVEPRSGLAYLGRGRVLVIYPEGELRQAGPLGPLADGAAWYARRAGVPLYAVGARVLLRGHQAPEAYVSYSIVDGAGELSAVTERLHQALAEQLSEFDEQVAAADPRRPLTGYRLMVDGRRSIEERIDAALRWLPWLS